MKKEFIKQNAGIDISKDDFKVNLSMLTPELDLVVKGSKSFNNNQEGFVLFKTWLSDKVLTEIELHDGGNGSLL